MLDQGNRTAILLLRRQGHSIRAIAKALHVCRDTVREVLRAGNPEVPECPRPEKAEAHREEILELLPKCKGNLVRVHERLLDQGAALSYQALTGFCRRHGIGSAPPSISGSYEFQPGEEMQHDTSPHRVRIGDRTLLAQDASLVLCHSRMLFHQYYPTFNRFWCKVFLTEALEFFGGACARCMIDNTHVVVQQGTGAAMIAVPEMAAFGERFGFVFRAHALGHANRSARVERPFDFIENNFLAGREFKDFQDLNRQAREWCEKVNATRKRSLQASPRELFLQERLQLRALPIHVPTVYQLHHRIVDGEGFINVQGNRYSVPYILVGRQLEVRETKDRIEVYEGPPGGGRPCQGHRGPQPASGRAQPPPQAGGGPIQARLSPGGGGAAGHRARAEGLRDGLPGSAARALSADAPAAAGHGPGLPPGPTADGGAGGHHVRTVRPGSLGPAGPEARRPGLLRPGCRRGAHPRGGAP